MLASIMPAGVTDFVDLHLHAEGLSDADLGTLAFFGLRAALTCSNDANASSSDDLRRHWDELVTVQVGRLKAAGIRPLVALGVHPARIPWHGVDALLHELPRYFDDPRVIALGELGLQQGGEREEEVLQRQLELSLLLRRPVLIHTPSADKLSRTRRLIALLREARVPPQRVLIDHVTAETFPLVRACGFWSGLTVQPGSFDADGAAELLLKNGAEGVLLTSDVGEGASDLLALPRAADALARRGLSDELRRRVLYENPLAFLGLGA
jgi:predicted metal-dependent TIM-barrel fold hydrolase